MQNSDNSNDIKLLSKIHVFVHKKATRVCPYCNRKTDRETFITKRQKTNTNDLSKCSKCNKYFVTYNLYGTEKKRFICLNPDEVKVLVDEDEVKREEIRAIAKDIKRGQTLAKRYDEKQTYAINYEDYPTKKIRILEIILENHRFFSKYSTDKFTKAWLKTKLSENDLESIESAYFIETYKRYYCYFVSTLEKFNDNAIGGGLYITSKNSVRGKQLYTVEKGTYKKPSNRPKPFDVYDYVVLNGTILQSSQKTELKDNVSVYVYFQLNNSCMRNKHTIETVTAKTTNAKNGTPINVNVFHCKDCDRHFINYEALQKYISKGIYPALQYSLIKDISGSLNDASKLMLYGYNVAEGILTQLERRSILSWIIDSGLLSKSEIIKDLQFKVRYNGSKPGNENARRKWQDDIQFVSRYVQGNTKTINARFVTR